jgi:hypothetical protein
MTSTLSNEIGQTFSATPAKELQKTIANSGFELLSLKHNRLCGGLFKFIYVCRTSRPDTKFDPIVRNNIPI